MDEAGVPDQVWAADITYVPTREGWLYLAIVLDLASRLVVGWSMGETLESSLAVDALNMAIQRRRPAAGLLHCSDRGVQYAARGASRSRLIPTNQVSTKVGQVHTLFTLSCALAMHNERRLKSPRITLDHDGTGHGALVQVRLHQVGCALVLCSRLPGTTRSNGVGETAPHHTDQNECQNSGC